MRARCRRFGAHPAPANTGVRHCRTWDRQGSGPVRGARAGGAAGTYLAGLGAAARMTQTWPGANVMRWPEARV
jgi:hypothetical protein